MPDRPRIVLDTSVLVSRLLLPDSSPGRATQKAIRSGTLLVSETTMNELADVLGRPKFNRYIGIPERRQFLRLLGAIAEFVPVLHAVRACRDSKDDIFLEVAVNGSAHLILTGDRDLLALNPFRNIEILNPSDYLKR